MFTASHLLLHSVPRAITIIWPSSKNKYVYSFYVLLLFKNKNKL